MQQRGTKDAATVTVHHQFSQEQQIIMSSPRGTRRQILGKYMAILLLCMCLFVCMQRSTTIVVKELEEDPERDKFFHLVSLFYTTTNNDNTTTCKLWSSIYPQKNETPLFSTRSASAQPEGQMMYTQDTWIGIACFWRSWKAFHSEGRTTFWRPSLCCHGIRNCENGFALISYSITVP